MSQGNLIRVWCKSTGVLDDMIGESGREEYDLDSLGQQSGIPIRKPNSTNPTLHLLLDTDTLISKTLLIQHVVGLVKDKDFDLVSHQLAAFDHVHSSPGGADNDLNFKAISIAVCDLRWNSDTRGQPFDEVSHDLNDSKDLTGQLTAWRKYKSLRGVDHIRRVVKA